MIIELYSPWKVGILKQVCDIIRRLSPRRGAGNGDWLRLALWTSLTSNANWNLILPYPPIFKLHSIGPYAEILRKYYRVIKDETYEASKLCLPFKIRRTSSKDFPLVM